MELEGKVLEGKVAVVTGASAGIGRAYSLALAGAGATVIAVARTLGPSDGGAGKGATLVEVVRAAGPLPGRIYAHAADVTVESDVIRAVEQAVVNFGHIDVLVNNAGLMTSHDPLAISCEEWDIMMQINVRGPYLMIREVAPHLVRQGSGSIVNITARAAGFMPRGNRMHDGTLAYGVSKAALNRLSYFFSEELRPHGIAVNALSPGVVMTDTAVQRHPEIASVPAAKPPTPEALGAPLIYLAQQNAQTLTGQILHTDEFQKSWP